MASDEMKVRTSYSSLVSYRECPHRWKNEPRGGGSEASDKGSYFHEAMKRILTGSDAGAVRGWLSNTIVASGMQTDSLAEVLEMFDRITSSKFYFPDPSKIITVESEDGEIDLHGESAFEVPLPLVVDGKRVTMSGRFDLVLNDDPDGIEIRDWKTGFMDAEQFQADYYALAAWLKYWRISPIKVRFVYARRLFSPRPLVYTSADMPAILEYVTILATSMIRDKEFKPRLNSQCRNCSLRTGCATFLEAVGRTPIAPEIDPENWSAIRRWKEHLANVAKAANGFLDDMKKLEESYLERHGTAIDDDGKTVKMDKQVGAYEYPIEKIIPVLENAGIDWKKAAKLTAGGIETAIESAVVEGKIKDSQAKEIYRTINGEKKKGQWTVEPIRQVSSYKKIIREVKDTEK